MELTSILHDIRTHTDNLCRTYDNASSDWNDNTYQYFKNRVGDSFKRNTRLFMNNALDSAYIIQNALNEIEAAASQLRAYKKP